jgi:DNA helicase-2/ATP-dependent DNA helicase PcrA
VVDVSELNHAQREAVEAIRGPVLVLAGAGSGKTRVLITRIAVLIDRKLAQPEHLLALTFTNKAARELRERLGAMIGQLAGRVRAGTFHSTFARLLRRDISALGYRSNFAIYDTDDSERLIKAILQDRQESGEGFSAGRILNLISRAKNSAEPPRQYLEGLDGPVAKLAADICLEYQDRLKRNNALDFDDLLLVPKQLFDRYPELLETYRNQFKYVLVDEYQDTNRAQYELVKALASRDRNICVVGDDDQSIYGWRGADLRNILEFEKDFPDAKVIRLEQNYRSTPQILDLAWNVIRQNVGRKEKKLWTQKEAGQKARLFPAMDENEEAWIIGEEIDRLAMHEKRPYGKFAVLYRINAQSRVLEDDLRQRGIPYDLLGSVRFYERREIKDLLAYLKVLDNPEDSVSLLRIINVPKRGIGDGTVRKLVGHAEKAGCSVRDALKDIDAIESLNKAAKSRLAEFHQMLCEFEEDAKKLAPSKLSRKVIDRTGIKEVLEKEGTEEAHQRVDNILEFRFALEEMEESRPDLTLQDFLQEVTLMTEVDEWEQDKGRVTLMTLHSAKGLEFPVVFVAGLEEGLIPLPGRDDRSTDIEEERRLLYVGMTRAMDRLYLSYANRRRLFGEFNVQTPSPFLRDIPEDLVEGEVPIQFPDVSSAVGSTVLRNLPKSPSRKRKPAVDNTGVQYRIGDRIHHRDFGEGTVLSKSGSAGDLKIRVNFENTGIKTLLVRLAPIQKLES